MARKILIGIAALLALFLVVVALQPAGYSVTRSATFSAPPAVVFSQVNDFHKWAAWSPWEKIDPAMKKTYSGAAAGVGAIYEWSGNDEVGQGRMTIVDAKPSEHLAIKLEFLKPFTAVNPTSFDFKPVGEGTTLTWTMSATNTFMTKAVGLFMNFEKMVGGDFDRGLSNLKAVAETEAQRLKAEEVARSAVEAAARAQAAAAAADAEAKANADADAKAKPAGKGKKK